MIAKWFSLSLVFFSLCVSTAVAAEQAPLLNKELPVEITAQQLEMMQQQRQSIFSGDVVAKQGDMTLTAAKLTVFLQKEQDQIDRLEASGAVKVTQLDRVATADKAVFYQLEEKLVLTGDATVVQGTNKVSGAEIVLYLKENRSVVKSLDRGRVKAVIVPEKKQE